MADNLPPNDNLESFFQESFKGFSEEPPDDLWDSIEANIPSPPSKKRLLTYRSWLSVAALLVLIFGVSVFGYKVWQHEQKIANLSEQVQDDSKKIKQLNKTVDSLQGVLIESKEEKNNVSNNVLTLDKQSDILANDGENMANNTVLHASEKGFSDENKKENADKNTKNLKAEISPFLENEKSFQGISKKRIKNSKWNENVYSNTEMVANFDTKSKNIGIEKNTFLTEKTIENSFSDKENIYEKSNAKNADSQSFTTENALEKSILKQSETGFYEMTKMAENNFANGENVFLKKRKNEFGKTNHLVKLQSISPLLSLRIDEIENLTKNKDINLLDKKEIVPEVLSPQKQGLAIGFYVAPTLPHRQLKNDNRLQQNPPPLNGKPPLKDRLKAEEKAQISFRFGTNIAIPITRKIGVETGFQYAKNRHTQQHLACLEYKENDAMIDANGDITSAYKYNLDTSYGEVEVDFEVTNSPQNDGQDLVEGDIIFLRFKSKHELNFISMPLLVSYKILEKRKMDLQIKTGVVGNFLIKKDINVEEIAAEKKRIKPKHEMRRQDFKDLKQANLDYQVGLAFNYHLNSKINLSLQPTFTRAFKAIHQHKNIKTVPMQTSLNIGVAYNL